jgi:hypothetical protein
LRSYERTFHPVEEDLSLRQLIFAGLKQVQPLWLLDSKTGMYQSVLANSLLAYEGKSDSDFNAKFDIRFDLPPDDRQL